MLCGKKRPTPTSPPKATDAIPTPLLPPRLRRHPTFIYHHDHPLPQKNAPLFADIGTSPFAVTTASSQAQDYVDQGVALLHGFWYYEALRSFRQATKIDPQCAMALWGIYQTPRLPLIQKTGPTSLRPGAALSPRDGISRLARPPGLYRLDAKAYHKLS